MIRRYCSTLVSVVALSLTILGGLLLAPAGIHAAQSTPCAEATTAELEAIAQRWLDVYNSHDVSALDAIGSPDIVHASVTYGDVRGIDEVKASQQRLLDAFPDLQLTSNLVITDAPSVAIAWTATGTQTGDLREQAATGATATWDGLALLSTECGRIGRAWVYFDQLARLGMDTAATDGAAGTPADAMTDASPAACPAATEEETVALLETWWGAAFSSDPAVLEAVATDDVVHHWAVGPDTVGAAAQIERTASLFEAMPDMHYTWGDILIDGDYAAAVWEGTATLTGEYLGNPATGKTATWGGMNIFRIECGRIAEVWSEMDLFGMRAQHAPDEAATPAP